MSKSKLEQATADPEDVVAGKTFYAGGKELQAGTMAERGNWGTTISPGGSVTIPQGYHSGGGVVRANSVGISAAINETYTPGDNSTTTRSTSVKAGETWIFVLLSCWGTGGDWPSLSTPSATTLFSADSNPTRSTGYQNRPMRIRILRFNASGTVTATFKLGNEWAGVYAGFYKITP